MIPNRWALRRYAKLYAALAAVLFLLAEVLERSRSIAYDVANDQVNMHEWNHHSADEEDDG